MFTAWLPSPWEQTMHRCHPGEAVGMMGQLWRPQWGFGDPPASAWHISDRLARPSFCQPRISSFPQFCSQGDDRALQGEKPEDQSAHVSSPEEAL